MMKPLIKFGSASDSGETFVYPNVWAEQHLPGTDRLIIAPIANHINLMCLLLEKLSDPVGVLYVLVVPRTNALPGRYQCEKPVSLERAVTFLKDFADFFEQDGRHHIWIASANGTGMLVYDRHNVILAYGPLSDFIEILHREGLTNIAEVQYPTPHFHNYHQSFDSDEDRLMTYWPWIPTPLKSQDEE